MPKSKRQRSVPLTQTAKKTRQHKNTIIQEIRKAVDQHEYLYVFRYNNMRSNKLKQIRLNTHNRIFLTKNKLMQIALGRTKEDEYGDNLRHVSKLLTGSVGLLFATNENQEEIERYFSQELSSSSQDDYARAGAQATRTIHIDNTHLFNYPSSMVEQFRKLGLPVEVQNGAIVLLNNMEEYTVCKKGEVLTTEQCKLLRHFGIKLAEFRVELVCRWSSNSGEFEMLE